MQFRHPHFFRPVVREALTSALPDVWDALLAAGGIAASPQWLPEGAAGLQCRRSTFERVLWLAASDQAGLIRITGHADAIAIERGRARGVIVDGGLVEADRVIVATGRAGKLGSERRTPAEGGPSGFAYVARMYRARPGVEVPATGLPLGELYRGYQAIVFPQDGGTLSALIVRPAADDVLAGLRHDEQFDAVAPVIPQLAPWTDPARFEPLTGAMAGGNLTNTYRGQLGPDGRAALPGVFFAGDAVCTTNPAAGRGVSLGLRQAQELLRQLAGPASADPGEQAERFDAWCAEHIRPWFTDHVHWDASLLDRLAGRDLDPEARIPSDVICAAAEADPSIWPVAGPYLTMQAPPSALDPARDRVAALLGSGWRPAFADGPSRDDLAGLLTLQPAA